MFIYEEVVNIYTDMEGTNRKVGEIRKDGVKYRYFPSNAKHGGKPFDTLDECKRSIDSSIEITQANIFKTFEEWWWSLGSQRPTLLQVPIDCDLEERDEIQTRRGWDAAMESLKQKPVNVA